MKLWLEAPEALLATKLITKTPPLVGIPASVPVPLWLSINVRPEGSVPAGVMLGTGEPVAVTVNTPFAVVANVALFALEIPSAWLTVSEKFCVELPAVFVAVKVSGKVPGEVGVPARVAVPLWLSAKVIPVGKVPASVSTGEGKPVVVTVNDPGDAP